MTSKQNTFMLLKAGPYNSTTDDLCSEIVRYCQAVYKPFLKKKNNGKYGIILYTCKDIICLFKVKARRQSHTAIWNVMKDSLNLAHTCGITFGNRKAPEHSILSMTYPQIRLYIPVTSKTGGTTKQLQKTVCVQAGIHRETPEAYACCQDKQSDDVVQQLG